MDKRAQRNGFTLVELLVGLACAALLMGILSTAYLYTVRTEQASADRARTAVKVGAVADYLREHRDTLDPDAIEIRDGDVYDGETRICRNAGIDAIHFSREGNALLCRILYGSETYRFTLRFSDEHTG